MTGFLRQLTQQATGRRLPGQPRPLRAPEALPPATRTSEPGFDEAGIEQLQEESERPNPTLVRPAAPVAASEPSLSSRSTASERMRESISSTGRVRDRSTTLDSLANQEIPNRTTSESALRFDSLEALLPAILNPRQSSPKSDAIDSSADRHPASDFHDDTDHDPAETDGGNAILHPRAPAPVASPPRRTKQAERTAMNATASVPDVHIHIGRIELTALQPPAPRPAPRREEKKPMSLEEYLRQRDGRRS